MSFRLEVVSRIERLEELRSEWSKRVAQAPAVTPLQTPEWILTWWKHFGSGDLHTLVIWNGNALVALVPCFRHVWQGARQLTLIGSGVTDYLEPYIAREHADRVVDSIGSHLSEEAQYDLCDWQDLSADSPLLKLAQTRSLNVSVLPDTPCSEVEFPCEFEEYWRGRSAEMRRNVRRYAQKAEREGRLEFALERELGGAFDALMELHAARWRKRGEPGMIEANQSGEFLRQVSAGFADSGALRLFTLTWQERVVAAILAISWNRKIYGYLSAFAPEFEHFGFGRILLAKSIEHAHQTSHRAWNFLRGEEPYKTSWGAKPIPKRRMLVRRLGVHGRV